MSWTPEDEKRLDGLRKDVASHASLRGEPNHDAYCARCWLLAKLDEEKRARTKAEKENVRIAKQSAENRARAVRVEAALDYEKRIHTQTTAALAEERAKREAAEEIATEALTAFRCTACPATIKRAETAEARVRELEGIGQNTASGRMREERDHYRAKALAAEARVAELEGEVADLTQSCNFDVTIFVPRYFYR